MKISIEKENLLNALATTIKATSIKTTKPILECFYIKAYDNKLKITATDLDLGIEFITNAIIEKEGEIIINAKMFIEIIRKLPENTVNLYINEQNLLIIECEGSVFKLVISEEKDFPILPEIEVEQSIEIEQNVLKDMIKKTIFATSIDENRPVFTGSLLELKNGKLNMVSLDGFRLALQKRDFETKNNFSAIIPARTLNDISKILKDEDTKIEIGVSKNQGIFKLSDCKAVTRIIEGQYLDYENAIPKDKELRIIVNKSEFLDSLDRASVMFRESDKEQYPLKLTIDGNIMIIGCVFKTGDVREELIIEKEVGGNIEIGFNPKYLIDVVKCLEDEKIILDFGSNISPCIIKSLTNDNYIYMVLPVRI